MGSRKENRHQQIQSFVRVRPLNNQEKEQRSHSVIDLPSNREASVRQHSMSKKFTFDRVFGPKSTQLELYTVVVNPLIQEVLAGYNCTVFAYGQTGTGKTYTMAGGSEKSSINTSWQNDPHAGIIPRTLSQLFDELRLLQVEHTVRVSYLELYNEELFDLLSPMEDSSKIRLYEDNVKKGSVIVHGLEEVIVHNKNEVYKILQKGSEKRQTASTLMNAQSSRSHTVFSITVHTKESTHEGEDLLKTGKLNLVDLAGSENIGRSGAVDKRAREAGNINQSLLTLGRVITALVERAPHVPYRESKLTRLLQDSLGGRTKTSIIATVSPAMCNLEETLSTLEYANRAKNITNRPEINQKFTKSALLKEYTEEIERLRRDLAASRSCNGIYLAPDNYNHMVSELENYARELTEKINEHRAITEELEKQTEICAQLNLQLTETQANLMETEEKLKQVKTISEEQAHLVEKHSETEAKLGQQARTLLNVVELYTKDTGKLHDKLERVKKIEHKNTTQSDRFQNMFNESLCKMKEEVKTFIQTQNNTIENYVTTNVENIHSNQSEITDVKNMLTILYEICTALPVDLMKMLNESVETDKNGCDELKSSVNTTLKDSFQMIADVLSLKVLPFLQSNIEYSNKKIDKIHENQQLLFMKFLETHKHVETNFTNIQQFMGESYKKFSKLLEKDIERTTKIEEINAKQKEKIEKMIEELVSMKQENQIIEDETNIAKNTKHDFIEHFEECCTGVENIEKQLEVQSKENLKDAEITLVEITKNLVEDENHFCEKSTKLQEIIYKDIEKLKTNSDNNIEKLHTKLNDQSQTNIEKHNQMKNIAKKTTENLLLIQTNCNQMQSCFENHHEKEKKICDASMELLRTQNSHFEQTLITNIHNRTIDIQKFLTEDIVLDGTRPTGNTPIRKDVPYPRYLAATSPHNVILERFRRRRLAETVVDQAEAVVINDVESITNGEENLDGRLVNDLSVNNGNGLVKAASTSDLSDVTSETCSGAAFTTPRNNHPHTSRLSNKENYNIVISALKSNSTSQINSVTSGKQRRRVLGSNNK